MNVGPDAPTTTNSSGGKQSDTGMRMDLIPARAIMHVAQVLDAGAKKYGEDNWKQLSIPEILNHVLVHIYAYLAGDTTDDHLSHAACRALMALEVSYEESKTVEAGPAPGVREARTRQV